MRVIGFAGANEIGGLRLAKRDLLSGDGAAKQLVNKPESIRIQNVTLAVLGDLGDPARLNHRLDLAAIDPRRFARQADDLADLVQLDPGSGAVGAEHVAEV